MTLGERLLCNLTGLGLFTAVGWSLLGFFPALLKRRLLAALSFAYLLGLSTLCSASWAVNHVLGIPLRRPLFLFLGAILLLAGWVARRMTSRSTAPESAPAWSLPAKVMGGAAATLASIVIGGMLLGTISLVTRDFDGQMTWTVAARYVRAAGAVDPPVLRERRWFVTHPRYPLLIPLSQVVTQEVFGAPNDDDRAVRWIYAFFYPVYLGVLFDGVRRRCGNLVGALVALVFVFIPLPAFGESGGASGTMSDFPLACFLGAAVLLLTERRLTASGSLAGGVFLASALLTKNEGGPLALAAIVAALLPRGVRAIRARAQGRSVGTLPWKAVACLVLPVLCAAALSISWRTGIVNRYDEGYEQMRGVSRIVKATIARAPLLPGPMWEEMRRPQDWGGFWLIIPFSLLFGLPGLLRGRARGLLLMVAGGVAVYVVAYGNTPWGEAELVHPTWSRFLLQLSMPGLTLLAFALRHCLLNVRRVVVPALTSWSRRRAPPGPASPSPAASRPRCPGP